MATESNGGGEDVNEFLARIKELGEKRDQEDAERTRRLEEEIIAGREARRARREERARSISPQKDSPLLTAYLGSSSSRGDAPGSDASQRMISDITLNPSEPEASASVAPKQPPKLSWQNRRSKSIHSLRSSTASPTDDDDQPANRTQIAASLESKDPTFFRQTADRNATSGALRKAEDEHHESTSKMPLPGMSSDEPHSRGATPEPMREAGKRVPPESLDTASSMASLDNGPETVTPRQSEFPSNVRRMSVASTSAERFERPISMSPSQGRISPDRSDRTPSPTKGLGGFVQSAMLKREGSINKRWSNSQQSGQLSRNNSTASERPKSLYGRPVGLSGYSGESSPGGEDFQTDNGSDSEPTAFRGRANSIAESMAGHGTLTRHTRAKSMRHLETTPPMSPSKTFEPKRWSPTKSSWLETALKKSADAPQPAAPAKPLQPVDLTPKRPTEKLNDPPPSGKPSAKPKPAALSPQSEKTAEKSFDTGFQKSDLAPIKPVTQKPSQLDRSSVISPILRRSPSPEKLEALWKPPPPKPKEIVNFRANLKPRPLTDKANEKSGPEFLNARTQLRSTKTQNYKVTDELKETILEGKSKLQSTGGPQKNDRPDEFKERVLSAKASLRQSATIPVQPSKVEPKFMPEITKQSSAPAKLVSERASVKPASEMSPGNLFGERGSPKPLGDRVPINLVTERVSPKPLRDRAPSDLFGERVSPKPLRDRAPSDLFGERVSPKPPSDRTSMKPVGERASALANRFNPNLANLLQRGPPAAAKPRVENGTSSGANGESASDGSGASAPLSHMTKSRARGPKRRAPTNVAAPVSGETPAAMKPSGDSKLSPVFKTPEPVLSSVARPLPTRPGPPSRTQSASSVNEPQQESASLSPLTPRKVSKSKPPTPSKSPLLRGNSADDVAAMRRVSAGLAIGDNKPSTPPPIKSPSSKVIAHKASKEGFLVPEAPQVTKQSPTTVAEEAEDLSRSPATQGSPLLKPEFTPIKPAPSSPFAARPPTSSPLPQGPPKALSRSPSPSPPLPSSIGSAIEEDNSKLLSDFFKGPTFSAPNVDFDIIGLLSANPAVTTPERVETIKFEVSEVIGHGKLNPVPQEQEHIFFDESMYLCVHRYARRSGEEVVEVYFWSGNKVSQAAVEDAQLFARKAANDLDTRLVRLTQGRETPTFLQAIGGILVTRRSSSAKSYLLCGRTSPGSSSVVFDEVDMKTSSLCSGYTFILSTPERVYLWKGRGAIRDEVSVARVVTGQISGGDFAEYNEEEEPDAFFDVLGGYEDYSSADYWHLRPTCRKYAPRLFKIDMESRYKVVEIAPFSQADLDPNEIYVADAFFEFYIFLGSSSQSRRTEFQIALKFTQEYAMLAVSIEDRPFMPISSVILGGAPKEFKALFRTWDNACPAVLNPQQQQNPAAPVKQQPAASGMRRARSIRLVGLSEAMEAMSV